MSISSTYWLNVFLRASFRTYEKSSVLASISQLLKSLNSILMSISNLYIFNQQFIIRVKIILNYSDDVQCSDEVIIIEWLALAGVVQWIECWPVTQRVATWIPSQGTCLGCRPGTPSGGHARGNHMLMLLSLSFSFPSPLSKNK